MGEDNLFVYIYGCVCVLCMYVCGYVCLYIYVCVCVYLYIYILFADRACRPSSVRDYMGEDDGADDDGRRLRVPEWQHPHVTGWSNTAGGGVKVDR